MSKFISAKEMHEYALESKEAIKRKEHNLHMKWLLDEIQMQASKGSFYTKVDASKCNRIAQGELCNLGYYVCANEIDHSVSISWEQV